VKFLRLIEDFGGSIFLMVEVAFKDYRPVASYRHQSIEDVLQGFAALVIRWICEENCVKAPGRNKTFR
jgi:hypothetical protein